MASDGAISFSPLNVLNEARRAVPVVDYALAAAGIAAACSLVIDFVGSNKSSFIVFGSILAVMPLVMLLGRLLKSESSLVNAAALFLTWIIVLCFTAALFFTISGAAFYWPPGFAQLLGMSANGAPLHYEGSPSFNCYVDRNDDEQTICHNVTVSQMDVQLDDRYQQLKNIVPADKFAAIQEAQRAWLISRRNCGNNVNCIKTKYTSRLSELAAALRMQ